MRQSLPDRQLHFAGLMTLWSAMAIVYCIHINMPAVHDAVAYMPYIKEVNP
jgi:hypothetical protein